MDNLQTARNFFEQCDYGKGWEACRIYCHQTQPLKQKQKRSPQLIHWTRIANG
jgi:hypothetical protein